MFGWLSRWWRERQRRTDIQILWPIFKEKSPTVEKARRMFLLHCATDPAWSNLSQTEIEERVSLLR